MTTRNRAPWLGALVATPALTVNIAPAAAISVAAAPRPAFAAADERIALKSGLLAMSLDEKLAVAGDRIGRDPLLFIAGSSSSERGATVGRTNTDIPECHTPGSSGAKAKGGHRGSAQAKTLLRTNTNIPECQGAGASGLKGHTNTSMCTVQQPLVQTAGSTQGVHQARTGASPAICLAPAASPCGVTKGGQHAITKGAITKGAPAAQHCGSTPPGQQMITKGGLSAGLEKH